jgi:hypothetical protein
MKRKSILMTIAAILLSSAVIGQKGNWPDYSSIDDAAGVDTIYFCERADSLYPVELGYDGSGLRLHPSYGNWSLIATSNDNVAADYNLYNSSYFPGNGGAGNAFKTVGTKYGGYVFQYEVTDIQCGLDISDKFYVFVFILPDMNDVVDRGDTLICLSMGTETEFDFNNDFFKEYVNLYQKAGIFSNWWPGDGKHKIRIDSIATYTLMDTLTINLDAAPERYTCGDEIRFRITLKVVDATETDINLRHTALSICADDTIFYADSNPNILFKRNNIKGTYSPDKIKDAPTVQANGKKVKVFDFTYNSNCDGHTTNTITDSLYLLQNNVTAQNWDRDTVIVCRSPGPQSIFTFYNDSLIDYPKSTGKLPLDLSNSYWYDRGLTGIDGALTSKYGTISGEPSLRAGSYEVSVDLLKSNMGYHYLWHPDPGAFPCLLGGGGMVDSGYVVVIVEDEIVAQDYTVQLCESSYYPGSFSFGEYTGMNVTWEAPYGDALEGPHKDMLSISKLGKGTHKFKYKMLPKCGPGGTGVFYVKIGPAVKVASSKTVKYCINKLPAMINLNDVLNIAVNGLKWDFNYHNSTSGITINSDIFGENGILDIRKFSLANHSKMNNDITLEFEVKHSPGCGINPGTKLVLKFVDNILLID